MCWIINIKTDITNININAMVDIIMLNNIIIITELCIWHSCEERNIVLVLFFHFNFVMKKGLMFLSQKWKVYDRLFYLKRLDMKLYIRTILIITKNQLIIWDISTFGSYLIGLQVSLTGRRKNIQSSWRLRRWFRHLFREK